MPLCPGSQGFWKITKPRSLHDAALHLSKAFLRQFAGSCKLQDQGAMFVLEACLGWAVLCGMGAAKARCPGMVFYQSVWGVWSHSALELHLPFFHLLILFHAQNQPHPETDSKLLLPQVECLSQSSTEPSCRPRDNSTECPSLTSKNQTLCSPILGHYWFLYCCWWYHHQLVHHDPGQFLPQPSTAPRDLTSIPSDTDLLTTNLGFATAALRPLHPPPFILSPTKAPEPFLKAGLHKLWPTGQFWYPACFAQLVNWQWSFHTARKKKKQKPTILCMWLPCSRRLMLRKAPGKGGGYELGTKGDPLSWAPPIQTFSWTSYPVTSLSFSSATPACPGSWQMWPFNWAQLCSISYQGSVPKEGRENGHQVDPQQSVPQRECLQFPD